MDELHQHIEDLIAEEHRLRGGHVDPDGAKRIESLERQLDQAWDLLRQRDALRRAGVNPRRRRAGATGVRGRVLPSVSGHQRVSDVRPAAAMPEMIAASSAGRDHIGQWLVGRSTQVGLRSSGMPARKLHSGCAPA